MLPDQNGARILGKKNILSFICPSSLHHNIAGLVTLSPIHSSSRREVIPITSCKHTLNGEAVSIGI